jgi:hypothetical protein
MEEELDRGETCQVMNVYVYCEGQTEEKFINETIAPYFWDKDIYLIPIICTTKRTATKKYKGGVSSYAKIRSELIKLCNSHKEEYVTTMFDFYALPSDTPGMQTLPKDTIYCQIEYVEKQIQQDLLQEINQDNLVPYLILHEFEGLLFSEPEAFSLCNLTSAQTSALKTIREQFETPEHINNGVATAPSKRILAVYEDYDKIIDGNIVAGEIGLHTMKRECPHFSQWISKIEGLKKKVL